MMNTPARRNVPPLVFPSNPEPGELFGGLWQWDGQKWGAAGLGGLPPDTIDEVPDTDIYGRSDGAWLADTVPPTMIRSSGNNHLQIGSILFQWGYLPNYRPAPDDWVHMPRTYAAPATILLTALQGGGGEGPNIFVTVGVDHEEWGTYAWAHRVRYEVQSGGVNPASQGFFWLAVGVAA